MNAVQARESWCAGVSSPEAGCSALTSSSLHALPQPAGLFRNLGWVSRKENLTLLSQQACGMLHHPAGLDAAVDATSLRALEQELQQSLRPLGETGILLSWSANTSWPCPCLAARRLLLLSSLNLLSLPLSHTSFFFIGLHHFLFALLSPLCLAEQNKLSCRRGP